MFGKMMMSISKYGAQLVTLYNFNLVSVFEDLNVNWTWAKWSVRKDALMVATCRFNEDWLNLKIWMAGFHTWGLERLASNTWKIKGKSWVKYGDHVVAFFFFFDNWYFSTLYAINFVHSLKGIREIEWWLNRWDLKYFFIFCKLWVGMLINKIWTMSYRLCCFSEKA